MGILKILGLSTKHDGQHEHTGKHAAGKHTKTDKPKRLPKGK